MANPLPNKSLGEVIRAARVARGKGLRELASKMGITPSYLSDIENDRRIPAEDILRKFGRQLDLDFDDLMARAGRLGEGTIRYMSRTPAAGVLFRKLSEENTTEDVIEKLSETLDELQRKKRDER